MSSRRPRVTQPLPSLTDEFIRLLERNGGEFRAPEGNGLKLLSEALGQTPSRVSTVTHRLIARGLLYKEAKSGKVYAYRLLSPDAKTKNTPARPLPKSARRSGGPAPPWQDRPMFPVTVRELTPEDVERLGLSSRPEQPTR